MRRGASKGSDIMKNLSKWYADGIRFDEDTKPKIHWERTNGQVGVDVKLLPKDGIHKKQRQGDPWKFGCRTTKRTTSEFGLYLNPLPAPALRFHQRLRLERRRSALCQVTRKKPYLTTG